jgi:hypothetical protein
MAESSLAGAGSLTRRGLVAGGAASGLLLATAGRALAASASASSLPVSAIEQIVGADGRVSNGVLEIDIDRDDIHASIHGVPFLPGFQIQHELFFQAIGGGRAILNGDLALKPSETQPVIDGFLHEGLVFQAFHQHLYDLQPDVWFMHYRGVGDALALARHIRAVIDQTNVKLPQHAPSHPTTPLPANRLADILGGDATIGENGVVTVEVPRAHGVTLGGIHVKPELGVSTNIQFEPLSGGRAAVVPDFSMTATEIRPVMAVMREHGWDVGCLYNQETAESPQLYFSHMFKTGDPVRLAREIRAGLVRTDIKH